MIACAIATGVAPGLACTSDTFQCSASSDCVLDALQGHCESNGHCSFDDSACASGRRYGELAPGSLAGECVPHDDTAGTGSATSSVGSGDSTTTSMTTESTSVATAVMTTSPTETTTVPAPTTTTAPTTTAGPSTGTGMTTLSTDPSDTSGGPLVTEVWGDGPMSDHPGTLRDTWINLNDENNEADDRLRLYTWPSFRVANAALMRWDLSLIAGAQIESAELTLHMTGLDGSVVQEDYLATIHRVLDVDSNLSEATGLLYAADAPWTKNPCCANGVPMAQADITGPESSSVVPSTAGPVTWDVTQTLQALVDDPSSDFGILLNPDVGAGADADRIFGSSEHRDASLRPSLEITYRSPQ